MKSFLIPMLALVAIATLALCVGNTRAEKIHMYHKTSNGLVNRGHLFETELRGSVAALKDKLSKAYDLPKEAFSVRWKGEEQPDTVDMYNFQSSHNLAELRLECDFYLVNVFIRDGKVIPIAGMRDDTIATLRTRVGKKLNIPRELISVLLPKGGALDDGERLDGHVASTRREFDLYIAYKPGLIRVKLPSGELVTFGFEPTDQVGNLKEKIQVEKGIARERQSLTIKGGGELEDNALVIEAGLSTGTILTLVERPPGEPHIVHVKMESKRLLTFEVETTDTVASLKGKISRAEGIPPAKQHLFKFKHIEMADHKKLGDYVTKSESVVDLKLCPNSGSHGAAAPHHVHVELLGEVSKISHLAIKPDDTAASVKSRLRSELSIPQENTLHLYFESKELEDDKPMLEHVINNGSSLYLMERREDGPERIHVKLPSGRVVTFNIAFARHVIELKRHIKSAYEKFQVERQRLIYNNEELSNSRSLDEYKLVSGSTLTLLIG